MPSATADEIAARMRDELRAWQGQRMRSDDVTAIVSRRPGSQCTPVPQETDAALAWRHPGRQITKS